MNKTIKLSNELDRNFKLVEQCKTLEFDEPMLFSLVALDNISRLKLYGERIKINEYLKALQASTIALHKLNNEIEKMLCHKNPKGFIGWIKNL